MTQSAKTDDDRIAAWREQRAAIAAADKAARLGRGTAADAPRAVTPPDGGPNPAPAPAEAEATARPDTALSGGTRDTSPAGTKPDAALAGSSPAGNKPDTAAAGTKQDAVPADNKPATASASGKPDTAPKGPQRDATLVATKTEATPVGHQTDKTPAVAPAPDVALAAEPPAEDTPKAAPTAAPLAATPKTATNPTTPNAKAPATPPLSTEGARGAATPSPAQALLDAARASAPRAGGRSGRRQWGLRAALALLPVLLTALYLGLVATPLYEARAVVAITRPGDAGSSVQAGLLGGEKPFNLQDVFRAATYIKSRALMEELEAETGFVSEISGEAIDPLRRLRDIPLFSVTRHAQFDRFVETSVDVQSGLLTLYVRAPDQNRAVAVSESVLANAEAQVARLGQALFDQRRTDAAAMRQAAEEQLRSAQARLLTLQIRHQDVDPRQRVENIYARIRGLEDEAYRTRAEIQKAQIAGVGENRQTANLEALVLQLDAQIRAEREQLVASESGSDTPLTNVLVDYDNAKLEMDLAREAVREAIEAEIVANREAALNRSIFQVVVHPDTDAIPLFPRTFGTLFAVLIASILLVSVLPIGRGRSGA